MDAVEEIKNRLSIEDVVSQYIELKRAGRNFRGLSPFSNEKTPSLMVSPEKQIWHDFSSGKGGNMFSFVMEMEGLEFKGALELLARQASVDLSQYRSSQNSGYAKEKEQILEALQLAAKFYQVQLTKSNTTLNYVRKERGYSKQTMLDFQLGYSPNQEDALTQFLMKKKFSLAVLKKAGLTTQRYRGPADMFRGRLMVPLMDGGGRVIGFTARQLDQDKNAPKYINTPQSPVYDKSRHVFGLHLAKEAIRKKTFAVVVEGNLDVIASHQAGVLNVVATAGTALTQSHLKTLGRFTPDVRLAFDQDDAGLTATERSIPIASATGINLSIITVPEGKDPDELIKKSPDAWHKAVNEHQYAVDWLMERYATLLDITTAEGKRRYSDKILTVVKELSDHVERDHYIVTLADTLSVSADALRTKMAQIGKPSDTRSSKRKQVEHKVLDAAEAETIKVQNNFLALVYNLPSLREYMERLTPEMLPEPLAQTMLQFLKANPDYNLNQSDGSLNEAELPKASDYGKMLVLLYEELYQHLEVIELRYEAARLQNRLIDIYVKTKKTELVAKMNVANEVDTQGLLEQAKALDTLLKTLKEH